MTRNDPFLPELTPDLIIRAYKAGIFPMSESADIPDVFWVAPEERGIIPLDNFQTSRSLKKAMRKKDYQIKVDTDFERVIESCATKGTERDSTWINGTIRQLYGELFDRKICHTVEIWDQNELVGGLYGLAIGAAFFGESMFHTKTNASKIALAHLVDRLNLGSFRLLDTQFLTPHLASLGGIEIPREEYEQRLGVALDFHGDFYAMDRQI